MAWTSPSTWVAGAQLLASQLNTQIRDNMKAIGDPWTAYTPVWTATGTAPALGNGTLVGAYLARGKTTEFRILLTMGSTTTYGTGSYRFSLPFAAVGTPANAALHVGGQLVDAGVTGWPVYAARLITTTTVDIATAVSATDPRFAVVGQTVPFTWGNTDVLSVTGVYEAA